MIDTNMHNVDKIIIKRKRISAEKSHTKRPYDVIDIIVNSEAGTVIHTIFGTEEKNVEIQTRLL
jgi:hypothetical protein